MHARGRYSARSYEWPGSFGCSVVGYIQSSPLPAVRAIRVFRRRLVMRPAADHFSFQPHSLSLDKSATLA